MRDRLHDGQMDGKTPRSADGQGDTRNDLLAARSPDNFKDAGRRSNIEKAERKKDGGRETRKNTGIDSPRVFHAYPAHSEIRRGKVRVCEKKRERECQGQAIELETAAGGARMYIGTLNIKENLLFASRWKPCTTWRNNASKNHSS